MEEKKKGQVLLAIVCIVILSVIVYSVNGATSAKTNAAQSGDQTTGSLRIFMDNKCSSPITVKIAISGVLKVNTVIKASSLDSITVSCLKDSTVYALFCVNGVWSTTQSSPGVWGGPGNTQMYLSFNPNLLIGCSEA
ncbi:MAG: hypothetical protein WCK39_03130 [Methanomassiliicoccales archaeon]